MGGRLSGRVNSVKLWVKLCKTLNEKPLIIAQGNSFPTGKASRNASESYRNDNSELHLSEMGTDREVSRSRSGLYAAMRSALRIFFGSKAQFLQLGGNLAITLARCIVRQACCRKLILFGLQNFHSSLPDSTGKFAASEVKLGRCFSCHLAKQAIQFFALPS